MGRLTRRTRWYTNPMDLAPLTVTPLETCRKTMIHLNRRRIFMLNQKLIQYIRFLPFVLAELNSETVFEDFTFLVHSLTSRFLVSTTLVVCFSSNRVLLAQDTLDKVICGTRCTHQRSHWRTAVYIGRARPVVLTIISTVHRQGNELCEVEQIFFFLFCFYFCSYLKNSALISRKYARICSIYLILLQKFSSASNCKIC